MQCKQGTPTVEELLYLAQQVVAKWRPLGLLLGLKDADLDEITTDHQKALDKSYAMFRRWKESQGSGATYKVLAKALDHKVVSRHDLVEQYCYDELVEVQRETQNLSLEQNQHPGEAKRALLSIKILPGKPFHETQRREKEIDAIKKIYRDLRQNTSSATVSAVYLTGPPGCGKTQLAGQFGEDFMTQTEERNDGKARVVATLRAQTTESLLESYKELYKKLGIQDESNEKGGLLERLAGCSTGIRNLLGKNTTNWLLIVDNVTINNPLREFWPIPGENSPWGNGLVLVTTQDCDIAPKGHIHAQVLSLASGMETGSALKLLATISGLNADEDAKEVAKELNFYPLSLACAAVYVRQMCEDRPAAKFTWKNYHLNLRKYFEHLEYSGFTNHNPCYPQSMLPAVLFSARRMAASNEILRATFAFLSYCALQPVPLDTVADYVLRVTNAIVLDDVKAKIAKCSLLIYPTAGKRGIEVVTLHQVTRFAFSHLRQEIHDSEMSAHRDVSSVRNKKFEKEKFEEALHAVNEAYERRRTDLDEEAIAIRVLLCPHLKEFHEIIDKNQWQQNKIFVRTLVCLADGLVHVAGATDSYRVSLLERAYTINKQLGFNDLSSYRLFCDFGYTLREAGKLDKATSILEEAKKISESQTGSEWTIHRSHLLNVLAFTYRESFHLKLAKDYMRLSVDETKRAYGDRHVQVAERLCNLGIILHDQWENEEAIKALDDARDIAESCAASETFIRGQVYNYTGKVQLRWYLGLYYTQPQARETRQHLQESRKQHELAFQIYKALHGDQHKFTAGVMMTYGIVELHLGHTDAAFEYCGKAFKIYKDSGHCAWPRAGTWLADVLLAQRNFGQAQRLLQQLMRAHSDLNLMISPGAYHPKALLAEACAQRGIVEEGEKMLKECLKEWRRREMDPGHYWVARARVFLEQLRLNDVTVPHT